MIDDDDFRVIESIDDLDQLGRDMLVLTYWMTKLSEIGVVAGGRKLTSKGLEICMQLIEMGHVVDDESVAAFARHEVGEDDDENRFSMFVVLMHIKSDGIDAIINQMKAAILSPEMEWYRKTPDGRDLISKFFGGDDLQSKQHLN